MKAIRPLLLVGLLLGWGPLAAEPWPQKPVRAVVPVGAGSTTDIVPRVIFEQLARDLGQPIVVENRAGAGGTIGAALVAKSEPDGHTLLVNSNAHTIAPAIYRQLPYNPALDFSGVAALGASPSVLVVSPASGYKSVTDLVAAAKAKPGMLNFSSVGVGTATHLSGERFRLSAGIGVVHVPFKGGAEAMAEVVARRIDFFFGPVGLVLPAIRDGRLVPLAVNVTERARALPDVPTLRQAGFVDAELPIWFGLFAPAKTPSHIVTRLHEMTEKALRSPQVSDKLYGLGVDPMPMTPAAFDAFVREEVALNARLVKAAGITQE
jgi:tripartite-type tricarboxylate transporter receptor subunit TctC